MGIFSKTKEKDELILVFKIGSASVGGALFWAQKSGIPKIIFSVREPIVIEEKIDIDQLLSLTNQSLETVAKKIYSAGLGAPSKIFCVLSSPWCISQTRIISLKKNTPFTFSVKLADDLIEKEIKLFEEENMASSAGADHSIRTIELKNIKTMLNGYETAQPLNQKVKELETTIFISMSGEKVLKKIEETIRKHFHFEKIRFSSFTLAFFTIVRDLYTEKENFLLVDISGEMTEIFMTKKSILRESISYPLGLNFLARGVAARLPCTLNEANSLISLFKDGHADKPTAEKIAPILSELKAEWLKKFQESLANLSHDISIPATVFVVLDKDLANLFVETIKTEQFSQYTLTESKFEVIFLGPELLHNIATFEESAAREPFTVIDSIYINRFLVNPKGDEAST